MNLGEPTKEFKWMIEVKWTNKCIPMRQWIGVNDGLTAIGWIEYFWRGNECV